MRLSDIKGDRVIEVIADIVEPVSNIAADKDAKGLFSRQKLPEGMTPNTFLAQRIRKYLPPILRTHKHDITAILAAINDSTVEEYSEKLNLALLVKDVTDLLTDEVFTELFISAPNETGGATSTSVQENITA